MANDVGRVLTDRAGHEPSRDASRPSGDHPSRDEVLAIGEKFLNACYSAWSCGEPEHRVRTMLDRADEFRAALAALDAQRKPIMLEIVAAGAVHEVWEGRWRTLSQTVAKDRLIRDAYGSYGVADFIEYAGQACGFAK